MTYRSDSSDDARSRSSRVDSLETELENELVRFAREVREHAYAPYSQYRVGAAIADTNGRIFAGVNVENGAYPTCLCAEHNALGSAVAAGARRFVGIAVVTDPGPSGRLGAPCGNCRQALSEFGLDLVVLLASPSDDRVERRLLRDLLPNAFELEREAKR